MWSLYWFSSSNILKSTIGLHLLKQTQDIMDHFFHERFITKTQDKTCQLYSKGKHNTKNIHLSIGCRSAASKKERMTAKKRKPYEFQNLKKARDCWKNKREENIVCHWRKKWSEPQLKTKPNTTELNEGLFWGGTRGI